MAARRCPDCGGALTADARLSTLLLCPGCSLRAADPTALTATLCAPGDGAPRALAQIVLDERFRALYQLERLLGAGAMGTVYRAKRIDGSYVAIKFLKRHESPELNARFVLEGELMTRVRHPNLVRVEDVGTCGGFPYLACEYVAGGTLRERLRRDRVLAPAVALDLMAGILGGVAACHEAAIVHRDLKPENVLLDERGVPKVADLGIAKDYSGGAPGLSVSGMIIGTPLYMPLEQLEGRPAVLASDVWSAAAMLHEMLTGRLPHEGRNVVEIHEARRQPVPPLDRKLPARLVRLVERALSPRPEERPASAREMLELLEACRRELPGEQPRAGRSLAGAPGPRMIDAGALSAVAQRRLAEFTDGGGEGSPVPHLYTLRDSPGMSMLGWGTLALAALRLLDLIASPGYGEPTRTLTGSFVLDGGLYALATLPLAAGLLGLARALWKMRWVHHEGRFLAPDCLVDIEGMRITVRELSALTAVDDQPAETGRVVALAFADGYRTELPYTNREDAAAVTKLLKKLDGATLPGLLAYLEGARKDKDAPPFRSAPLPPVLADLRAPAVALGLLLAPVFLWLRNDASEALHRGRARWAAEAEAASKKTSAAPLLDRFSVHGQWLYPWFKRAYELGAEKPQTVDVFIQEAELARIDAAIDLEERSGWTGSLGKAFPGQFSRTPRLAEIAIRELNRAFEPVADGRLTFSLRTGEPRVGVPRLVIGGRSEHVGAERSTDLARGTWRPIDLYLELTASAPDVETAKRQLFLTTDSGFLPAAYPNTINANTAQHQAIANAVAQIGHELGRMFR